MSNGSPPIQPAPVPPSITGTPQPVFGSGDTTTPAAGPITGSPILPPPLMGDPVGFPVFPPLSPDTAPVAVPVGPLVGPAVGPAPVPPSLPGVQQPQFVPPGSATVPTAASLFPEFTTTPPYPPIVFANIFKIGPVPPPLPSTPGQNPPPIVPSPVPTIPQIPWPPHPPTSPPVNTVLPLIAPSANLTVGEACVLSTGTWTGAATYARIWLRDGSPIAGATGPSYVLVAADLAAMISATVTAIGAGGETSANALAVGPVENVSAPTNTAPPVVSGTPAVGTTLNRTTGTWTGSPTFTQIWQRGTTDIAGATGATYTPVTADGGAYIRCAVTGTNAGGSNIEVSNSVGPVSAPPVNAGAPEATIAGGGQPIVGTVINQTPGTWTGAPTFTQQWRRNGTNIAGATGVHYVLVTADIGLTVDVVITATNFDGSGTATSNAVGPVLAGSPPVNTVAPTVSVSGQPSVGSIVQRTTGTWTGSPTFTQQWQLGANTSSWGDKAGATGTTYTLVGSDIGNICRVRVIGTNSYGNSSAYSSNHVGPVVAALGADEEEGEPSEESEPVQTPARRVTRHASKPTRKR